MSVNMQLPPPTVTGVAIPANLATKGDMATYKELQSIREQARDELSTTYSSSKKKTKTFLKYALGTLTAIGAFVGIKTLISKIK